jgi:hypothetical protein
MARGFKRPGRADEGQRIETALANGAVLRFTGHAFEECGRPAGQGPKYSALAVLRRVRMGRIRLSVNGEVTRTSYLELEARAAPKRTSDALAAALADEART